MHYIGESPLCDLLKAPANKSGSESITAMNGDVCLRIIHGKESELSKRIGLYCP